MVFFKTVEVKDAQAKYGFSHKGVFAKEPIKRGEAIFTCDLSICDYLKIENIQSGKTREETFAIFKQIAHAQDFIHKYSYMVDDDLYDWPKDLLGQTLHEDCMFFNHSCDPNTGFNALDSSVVIAIRDIDEGEELCYDYQCMDTEASLYDGLQCRCGSFKCRGTLSFDQYRNVDWQNAFYDYSGAYVKRKIDELKTKWYSSRCFLKYYKMAEKNNNNSGEDKELGLTTFRKIGKDDLVAIFSDANNIKPSAHNIRNSTNPTCYLIGNRVYASKAYEPDTELTIDYSKI